MREINKISLFSLADDCANVCWFVLFSLDIREIDENANFRNTFCNCAHCKKYWYYR